MSKYTNKQIAGANDLARAGLGSNSSDVLLLTHGVKYYSAFSKDNDPDGEHDYGAFQVYDNEYAFKIDYYDQLLEFGVNQYEEDCRRVITVMRLDER